MTSDVCLVILFNHRFEDNIPKLYHFYSDRFENIKVIIPFYKSEVDPRIIRVYDNSWNFQGYISQAYSQIKSAAINQYIFTGDDCLLNPTLNQNNIIEKLNLGANASFISSIQPLTSVSLTWLNFTKEKFGFSTHGVNFWPEIPAPEVALKKIKSHDQFSQIPDQDFFEYLTVNKLTINIIDYYQRVARRLFTKHIKVSLKPFPKIHNRLPYPLLMGYSDFFTVSKNSIDEFAHLCGVFSSMRMFAEIAIPTALALSSQKLVGLSTTDFQAKAFWGDSRKIDLEKLKIQAHSNINELFLGERQNMLWYHPIKLSSWDIK